MDWSEMVAVGRIIRPHGIRGQVVIDPETDFGEDRFRPGATLHAKRDGAVEDLIVAASREHQGRWVVGFVGVESIEAAETWRGRELRVPAEALRALGPNAFYVHDLVGCEVRTIDGILVGVVARVDLATGVPMLAVTGGPDAVAGEEVLVPFVDAICRSVDAARKQITIAPPTGLVELNVKAPRSR